jgi:predicted dithiol-disulfide oxidoreductase (DUF899 family)
MDESPSGNGSKRKKSQMKARDALVAERRRMPWKEVDAGYRFEGPKGRVTLLDLFEGRRQLIVYRAFFEPEVHGWPVTMPVLAAPSWPTRFPILHTSMPAT